MIHNNDTNYNGNNVETIIYSQLSIILFASQGCHLSFTSKFPDLSPIFPTFYSFPYPLIDKKKSFLFFSFNGANYITSNLGVTLNGKNLLPKERIISFKSGPNEERDEFRLSHEKVHPFPS